MKLSEILAISGQQGLFKFVAQSKNGIIVESLIDSKRMLVQGTSKVSALGDIAIFTESEDLPLAEIFEKIYTGSEGKQAISHKEDDSKVKIEFERFIPEYDKERVRISDIKKVFSWYNILVSAGLTSFVEAEETEENNVDAEAVKEVKKAAPKAMKKTAAPKNAAKTSAAKVTKIKTAPKAK